MLPNVFAHEAFGKLLFVACDLLVGRTLFQILRLRGHSNKSTAVAWRLLLWAASASALTHMLWSPLSRRGVVHEVTSPAGQQ